MKDQRVAYLNQLRKEFEKLEHHLTDSFEVSFGLDCIHKNQNQSSVENTRFYNQYPKSFVDC